MKSILFWMEIQRIEGYDRLVVRWWWFALAIAALMILLAVWRLIVQIVVWWIKPRSNPQRLFRQLIRLHGLTKYEKSLVKGLAPKLPQGAHAAVLFVDPSSWAWKQVEDTKTRDSLEKLYLKIFGFARDLTRT